MTHKAKRVAMLLLAASILLATPTAYAAATKILDVSYRGIKTVVDGKTVALIDNENKKAEPFLVANGTIYVPAVSVGSQLGYSCAYDTANNTLTYTKDIGETGETLKTRLVDLTYSAKEGNEFSKWTNTPESARTDNTGTLYKTALGASSSAINGKTRVRWQEYHINSGYHTLKGTYGIPSSSKNCAETASAVIRIYGDDSLLFESDTLQKGFIAKPFTVDLTNVKMLRIALQFDDKSIGAYIFDGALYL